MILEPRVLPYVFEAESMGESYPALLDLVLKFGDLVRPRGDAVREVRGLRLELKDPRQARVFRPGFSEPLMYAEMAMVLGGVYASDLYDAVAPKATRHLLTEHGAYGPRIASQLVEVVKELTLDGDSRRAVAYVAGHADLALVDVTGDMPCTTSLQFFVRNGALECHTTMRSWDLVWGLGYDLPVFTTIQRALAWALQVDLGTYVHAAGSAHVYERHWDLDPPRQHGEVPDVTDVGYSAPGSVGRLRHAIQTAKSVALEWHNRRFVPPGQWEPAVELWRRRR